MGNLLIRGHSDRRHPAVCRAIEPGGHHPAPAIPAASPPAGNPDTRHKTLRRHPAGPQHASPMRDDGSWASIRCRGRDGSQPRSRALKASTKEAAHDMGGTDRDHRRGATGQRTAGGPVVGRVRSEAAAGEHPAPRTRHRTGRKTRGNRAAARGRGTRGSPGGGRRPPRADARSGGPDRRAHRPGRWLRVDGRGTRSCHPGRSAARWHPGGPRDAQPGDGRRGRPDWFQPGPGLPGTDRQPGTRANWAP